MHTYQDLEIRTLIDQEAVRQQQGLEMIASENFVSEQVREAQGSILTNKYAEGLPGKRYYGGCAVVDAVESLAIARAKELFGASWANVQPHSGAQANMAVMLGLLQPRDTIMGFDLAHGGHLSHGSAVNFSGRTYHTVSYGVDPTTGLLDYAAFRRQAMQYKPKLIIAGASAYSRDWDYGYMREVANQVGALLWADIAHPAGLIAKGILHHPLPHCHIVTTTTHKTLRGPRGGMILAGEDIQVRDAKGKHRSLHAILDQAVFPGIQGGPLEHVIAAKAVAFHEALTDGYARYVMQTQHNARTLAAGLMERGYKVITQGTDNHLVMLDLRNKGITGLQAEQALDTAHIAANKNMVPFDETSPRITSGLRLGTAALTTRGLGAADMQRIVRLIDRVLSNIRNTQLLGHIGEEVQGWMASQPMFTWEVGS